LGAAALLPSVKSSWFPDIQERSATLAFVDKDPVSLGRFMGEEDRHYALFGEVTISVTAKGYVGEELNLISDIWCDSEELAVTDSVLKRGPSFWTPQAVTQTRLISVGFGGEWDGTYSTEFPATCTITITASGPDGELIGRIVESVATRHEYVQIPPDDLDAPSVTAG
jgi:hypothetical protein